MAAVHAQCAVRAKADVQEVKSTVKSAVLFLLSCSFDNAPFSSLRSTAGFCLDLVFYRV